MKFRLWFALGALATASLAVTAQEAPQQKNPLDAGAAVPAPAYVSAFDGFVPAAPADAPAPDKVWRAANEQVANPEAAESGHAHHGKAPEAKPAQPQAPAPAPAPAQQHQHKHEGH